MSMRPPVVAVVLLTLPVAPARAFDLVCFKSGANEVCYGPQGYVSIEQELDDGRYVVGRDNRGHEWRELVFGGPHDRQIMRRQR